MSIFKKMTGKNDKNQSVNEDEADPIIDESKDLIMDTADENPPGDDEIVKSVSREFEDEPADNETAQIEEDDEMTHDEDAGKLENEPFLTKSLDSYEAPDFKADLEIDTTTSDVTEPEYAPEPRFARDDEPDYLGSDFEEEDSSRRRVNLGDMRLDVARINSDIESGEALYQRAQQRVQTLTAYIERAEVDFSLLNRLEPENRRLKSRRRALESEIETLKNRNSVLYSNLEQHKKRVEELSSALESTNAKLAKTSRILEDRDIDYKSMDEKLRKATLDLERARTDLEVETRENKNLRAKVSDLSAQIQDVNYDKLGLAKSVESLKIDCDDQRKSREKLADENADLRFHLSQAEKQNNQMKNQLVAVHEEIKSFKTQYEFNILSRDDRIIALEGQVADLSNQLSHKDNIVESAARDVSSLRRERTAQEMERQRLEKIIRDQGAKLNDVQTDLLRSKQDLGELDQRYKDVASALEASQRARSAPRPAPSPDIHPKMDEIRDEMLSAPEFSETAEAGPLNDPLLEPKTDPLDEQFSDIDQLLNEYRKGGGI